MILAKIIINCYTIFCFNASDTTGPQMFLCLDSMMQKYKENGNTPQKLVYGYIDGKKTECMSEYALRECYNKMTFAQKNSALPDSQKLLELNGQKRKTIPEAIKKDVYKGKKDLAAVDLRGCDLKGLDLSGADLHNANLQAADLRDAILTNANLSGANLESAYLKAATLKNADMKGCQTKGAYFHFADLRGVKGFTLDNVRVCATVYETLFDTEFTELVKQNCQIKLNDPGWQWNAPIIPSVDSLTPEAERVNRKQFR